MYVTTIKSMIFFDFNYLLNNVLNAVFLFFQNVWVRDFISVKIVLFVYLTVYLNWNIYYNYETVIEI